ncbi:hypothetical protein RF11_12462 [Thelohanellus kitauei]|uniref:Uncharacterized protein n=1 Tax=Thelohanellus kitauei TaxID=669202 RepID=A0A0C2JUJ1_THEKT|nr:hypothetical protein RF11_12462 [Thelohanellus kitauei]
MNGNEFSVSFYRYECERHRFLNETSDTFMKRVINNCTKYEGNLRAIYCRFDKNMEVNVIQEIILQDRPRDNVRQVKCESHYNFVTPFGLNMTDSPISRYSIDVIEGRFIPIDTAIRGTPNSDSVVPIPVDENDYNAIGPTSVDFGDSNVANPVPEDSDNFEVANPVSVDFGDSNVVNPVPENKDNYEIANPVSVDFGDSNVVNPVPENKDNYEVVNPAPMDFENSDVINFTPMNDENSVAADRVLGRKSRKRPYMG